MPWTGLVVTVNVTVLLPAGIVAEDGTWALAVLLLARVTTAPDGGAAPLSVKVPVDDDPPTTGLGERVSEVKEAAVTVSVVVRVVM